MFHFFIMLQTLNWTEHTTPGWPLCPLRGIRVGRVAPLEGRIPAQTQGQGPQKRPQGERKILQCSRGVPRSNSQLNKRNVGNLIQHLIWDRWVVYSLVFTNRSSRGQLFFLSSSSSPDTSKEGLNSVNHMTHYGSFWLTRSHMTQYDSYDSLWLIWLTSPKSIVAAGL